MSTIHLAAASLCLLAQDRARPNQGNAAQVKERPAQEEPAADPRAKPARGAAPVVPLDAPLLWACESDRIYQGVGRADHLGRSLALGDWNGDGELDLLAGGAQPWSGFNEHPGRAVLFLGPLAKSKFTEHDTTESTVRPDVVFEGPLGGERFGWTAEFVGDVDGDGRDDIAIGAPKSASSLATITADSKRGSGEATEPPTFSEHGAVYLFLTSHFDGDKPAANVGAEVAALAVVGDSEGDRLGMAVCGLGDFDADGLGDLALGAPGAARGAGSVFVVRGADLAKRIEGKERSLKASASAWMRVNGAAADDRLGSSLAFVADALPARVEAGSNRPAAQGLLAIGAPQMRFAGRRAEGVDEDGLLSTGPGYVLALSAVELAAKSEATRRIAPPFAGDGRFGFALTGGVDLDGDGLQELLVGEPQYDALADESKSNIGAVHVYRCQSTEDEAAELLGSWKGAQPGGQLGWSVAALPNLPGGRRGLAAGMKLATPPEPAEDANPCAADPRLGSRSAGLVQILAFDPNSGEPAPVLYLGGQDARDRLGYAVASGDVDGDGITDLFAGALGWPDDVRGNEEWKEAGRAYLLLLSSRLGGATPKPSTR